MPNIHVARRGSKPRVSSSYASLDSKFVELYSQGGVASPVNEQ